MNIPNELIIAGGGILLLIIILILVGIRKGVITILSVLGIEINLQKLLGWDKDKKDSKEQEQEIKRFLIELDEWKRLHNVIQNVLEKLIDLASAINLLRQPTLKSRYATDVFLIQLHERWRSCERDIIISSDEIHTFKVICEEKAIIRFVEEMTQLRKMMSMELQQLSIVKDSRSLSQVFSLNNDMLDQAVATMRVADKMILLLVGRAKQAMKIPV